MVLRIILKGNFQKSIFEKVFYIKFIFFQAFLTYSLYTFQWFERICENKKNKIHKKIRYLE